MLPLCLSLHGFLLVRTPVILGQKPTLLQYDLILTNCITPTLFPNNVGSHSEVLGVRTQTQGAWKTKSNSSEALRLP